MTDENIARTSKDRVNPHVKWLCEAATLLNSEKRISLANTCEQAARELEAVLRHRDSLLSERLSYETPQPASKGSLLAVAREWEKRIAVAYNEYSSGMRRGLEVAAGELRALAARLPNETSTAHPDPRGLGVDAFCPHDVIACDAAYQRACLTNRKAADALRPAMRAILEAAVGAFRTARQTPSPASELTACYSRAGLEAFIARHFPDSYLAPRPAQETSESLPVCATNDALHSWSVKGHIGNPTPEQLCENGCGLMWKDRPAQKADDQLYRLRPLCTCQGSAHESAFSSGYTPNPTCPVHAENG